MMARGSIVTTPACRDRIVRRRESRWRNSSNVGSRRRSPPPGARRPTERRWCGPASRATAVGAWDLSTDGDTLAVSAAGRDAPDVWIRQSAPDLRVALGQADPDLPELLPDEWSAQDLLFADPRDLDLLRQISGRLLFEIQGRRRRRWALDVAFGKAGVSAGRPRTTLRRRRRRRSRACGPAPSRRCSRCSTVA